MLNVACVSDVFNSGFIDVSELEEKLFDLP